MLMSLGERLTQFRESTILSQQSIVRLQSLNNYNLVRIVLSCLRLNYVAVFALETGSVQGINYPLTTKYCAPSKF